jgi:O-antigen ligase
VEGPIGAANQYGALLVFLLPIMISLTPRPGERLRIFWLVMVLASIILLVATGSRGAYVALVAGAALATVYLREYLNPRLILRGMALGSLCALVAVGFVMFTSDAVFYEVTRKSAAEGLEEVSSGRTDIWVAAYRVMLEWPLSYLVGYGWNSYESSGIWKAAHSVYVDTWYELGIVGLLLLLWLHLRIVIRTRSAIANAPAPEARVMTGYLYGFMGLLIAMVFVEIPIPATFVWMITGAVAGLQSFSLDTSADVNVGDEMPFAGENLHRASP